MDGLHFPFASWQKTVAVRGAMVKRFPWRRKGGGKFYYLLLEMKYPLFLTRSLLALSATLSAASAVNVVSLSPSAKAIFGQEALETGAPDSEIQVPFLLGNTADSENFSEEDSGVLDESGDFSEAGQKNPEFLAVDMSVSALPLESGRITSPFGFRHYRIHKGIDIGLRRGDTVRAAFPGKVVRVRYERRGYGKYIVLKHENCGISRTIYAHLSKYIVKVGDEVEAGTPIGLGGSTGRSTGPHLHFEMRAGEMPLDPTRFFEFGTGPREAEIIAYPMQELQSEYAAHEKEASKHRYHRVRPGDTLSKIARKYRTSVSRLQKLNGLKKNSILRVGRLIRCS